jgi:hypothetical protein
MRPLTNRSRELILAKVAAGYLHQDDDSDPLVWHGLEYRDIDYSAVLDRTGPIVLRSVVFDVDTGRFAIDPLGEQAFVHAVHGENPNEIVDIVAWSASRPHLYGTYLGYAGLIGVGAVLDPASFSESPCPIWAMPLAWLQSGLKGCVVLNAALAAPILASAPGSFQCEDNDHARWLVESGAIPVEKLMVPQRSVA